VQADGGFGDPHFMYRNDFKPWIPWGIIITFENWMFATFLIHSSYIGKNIVPNVVQEIRGNLE
jgi:hypothetical protein